MHRLMAFLVGLPLMLLRCSGAWHIAEGTNMHASWNIGEIESSRLACTSN